MTRQLFKPILIGIAIGAVIYAMPFFFFPGFFFVFIIFGLMRFFWWGRRWNGWRRYHGGIHPAFTDTIRNMTDEEYQTFKRKYDAYPPYYHEGPTEKNK
jgi:hypothetical protein